MKNKHLYIIGNGFDQHHDIRSGYMDFQSWVEKEDPLVYNRLFQVYELYGGNLWASLEENLGHIPAEAILNRYCEEPMIVFVKTISGTRMFSMDDFTDTISEIGYPLQRMYNELEELLTKWVLQLFPPNISKRISINKEGSMFINFNYTNTLESIYGIPASSILYIHGCAMRNEPLVFGHNQTRSQIMKNWGDNFSEEELLQLEEAVEDIGLLYKNVYDIIYRNDFVWNKIKNTTTIHILGMSLSEVDLPYLIHILNVIDSPDLNIEFSWYSEKDKEHITKIASHLGIKRYSLVKLTDMIRSYPKQLELFD